MADGSAIGCTRSGSGGWTQKHWPSLASRLCAGSFSHQGWLATACTGVLCTQGHFPCRLSVSLSRS